MAEGGREAVRVDDEVIGAAKFRQLGASGNSNACSAARPSRSRSSRTRSPPPGQKNRCCASRRAIRTVPDEGRRRHAAGRALEPGRAGEARWRPAATAISQGRRRRAARPHSAPGRRPAELWLPADHRAPEPPGQGGRAGLRQPQAGLPGDEAGGPAARAAHRPRPAAAARWRGCDACLEPALGRGRVRDPVLERRRCPDRLRHRHPRPRGPGLDRQPAWDRRHRDTRPHAARRRTPLLRAPNAAAGGVARRQRQLLHSARDRRLRPRDRSRAVLHAGPQPRIQRHRRSLREDLQARLCPPLPQTRRSHRHGPARSWFEDYNEMHPHRALGMRSPRQFIRAHQPATCPVRWGQLHAGPRSPRRAC